MTTVRSPGLLALSLGLLSSAAVLAAVLTHGLGDTAASLDDAGRVRFAGTLAPVPTGHDSPAADPHVREHLGNHTLLLRTRDVPAGTTVLVTGAHAALVPGHVVVQGRVTWRSPDGAAHPILIVTADRITPAAA
jgi:hypothetical protein